MEQTYQIASGTVARKNPDGSMIVMKMDDSSFFYKIDGIASEVWSLLSEKTSSDKLVSELTKKYPDFSENLQKDIPVFMTELLNKKLIMESVQ